MLQDHVTGLENMVRWRWSAGDMLIWDNRAMQHARRLRQPATHRAPRDHRWAGQYRSASMAGTARDAGAMLRSLQGPEIAQMYLCYCA
jgi:Taurine catabolism dioxygenase TauD, TfdA family